MTVAMCGRRIWFCSPNRFEKSLGNESQANTDKYPGPRVTGNQSCSKTYKGTCRDKEMPAVSSPVPLLFNR